MNEHVFLHSCCRNDRPLMGFEQGSDVILLHITGGGEHSADLRR